MTSNNKIGSTTTVNEQVDEMEVHLWHDCRELYITLRGHSNRSRNSSLSYSSS